MYMCMGTLLTKQTLQHTRFGFPSAVSWSFLAGSLSVMWLSDIVAQTGCTPCALVIYCQYVWLGRRTQVYAM